jgi:soluble lytic murein transglycosylase-like protein
MRQAGLGSVLAALIVGTASGAPAAAATGGAQPAAGEAALCRTVDRVAAADRLSAAFLTRILWQESRLRSDALSPKGAQGVAQFMPPTAVDRGLADPWDPGHAITAAGRLLADLAARFGNVGLAAAAYNAGAGRVEKWLRAESGLPAETRDYVRIVTGRAIEDWAMRDAGATWAWPRSADCLQTIAELPRGAPLPSSRPTALDRLLAHALSLAESQDR